VVRLPRFGAAAYHSSVMPQLIDFPPLSGEPRAALLALGKAAREVPEAGEPFRELRTRLRGAKLWERERPLVTLRFLGAGGKVVQRSPFMQKLAEASGDDAVLATVLDRLWAVNPLLFKTIHELVGQRAYGKDEIYKHLGSFAYRGAVPSRPALETWLQIALACGLVRPVGIAVAPGPRAADFDARVGDLDVDEFLAEDRPEPEPEIPGLDDDGEIALAPAPAAPTPAAAPAPGTATATASAPSPLPAVLRPSSSAPLPSPRNRDRVIPVSRFAQGFSDELLEETTRRIAAWWVDVGTRSPGLTAADFGLDAEAWVEGADEVVYRIAVAAALAFRLDADRAGVVAAYRALDRAGVLADLYHGTVPEELPTAVDGRALMLASLAARRCAETPELASTLEQKESGAEVFAALDAALGRGLFRGELFWMIKLLAELGVIRHDDLADFTVQPHRLVRDTCYRLGFVESPYAADASQLAVAARAARRAAGDAGPADEVLASFAIAAGCAYDCTHRKACDFPCRERLE
jgi:hypothetical protein